MAQNAILTKPLFMQIKSPKLESCVGRVVDTMNTVFEISPEGRDSIDISFKIIVPKEMLSEKWAISLRPTIESTKGEEGILTDIVLKGWEFAEAQEEDYEEYNNLINSIVDSSLYEKEFIDRVKLEKEIEQRHDFYWKFYYDEWERQVEYEIWKANQDGSSKVFSVNTHQTYYNQLRDQYLLRIKNQSDRYIKAGMDTTGIHEKYMTEFGHHIAKMPRYVVDNKFGVKRVPKKFKDIYDSGRTLDDITASMQDLLIRRDSLLMSIPILDYKKIIENEKRMMKQDDLFEDVIRFPKNENAILDTIVYDIQKDYDYVYTYRYPISKQENDTIVVKLESKILATDLSGFSSAAEEKLTYVVKEEDRSLVDSVAVDSISENKIEEYQIGENKFEIADTKNEQVEKKEQVSLKEEEIDKKEATDRNKTSTQQALDNLARKLKELSKPSDPI